MWKFNQFNYSMLFRILENSFDPCLSAKIVNVYYSFIIRILIEKEIM
jgi:hypothetical protein